MTLTQLKYAIAVAGENSLNDAAQKLFISQPSLSSSIHSLEKEIGIELFRRSKSGIRITPEGEEFIGYARQVVEQFGMDEYEFAVHETKTHEVIEDVKNYKSEIGVLYLNEFNSKILTKLFPS